MKKTLALTLSLFSSAVVCSAAAVNPDEQTIRDAYQALGKAILNLDKPAILQIYAPQFVGWGPRYEPLTREALAEAVPAMVIKTVQFSPLKFEPQGNNYLVTARSMAAGEYNMGGQKLPFEQTGDSLDLWQKVGGRWQIVGSQHVSGTVNVAGQKQVMTDPAPLSAEQRQALSAALHPLLQPVNPTALSGVSDLSFLKALASARVIGAGEGSHGTHEHFLLKARIFKALVQEYGFNTLAFEANMHGAEPVNAYISGRSTDLAAALKGLGFAIWRTAEVRDLLVWMREYNATRGTKPALKYVAVDMQHPGGSAQLLTSVAPALKDVAAPFVKSEPYEIDEFMKDPDQRATYLKQAEALVKAAAALPTATPRRTEVLALARNVQQAVLAAAGQGKRDDFMAENLLTALKNDAQAKIMLWAHNGHVSKAPDALSQTGMGQILAAAMAGNYRTIGQTFTGGSIRAVQMGQEQKGTQEVRVAAAHPDSLEGIAGTSSAALIMNEAMQNPVLNAYLSAPRPIRGIGFMSRPGAMGYTFEVLPKGYDVLIFTGNSTPTQPAN